MRSSINYSLLSNFIFHLFTSSFLINRAPEVILTLGNYGYAVDMWSTGCILAELMKSVEVVHRLQFSDSHSSSSSSLSCLPFIGNDSNNHHHIAQNDYISAELVPFFPGKTSTDVLAMIIDVLGTPSQVQS